MIQNHTFAQRTVSHRRQSGYILIVAMIFSFALSAIGISLASVAAAKYAKTKRDSYVSTANYAAESGISIALARLYDDTSATGTGYSSDQVLFSSSDSGKATYSVKVENGPSAKSRYISAIGKFYFSSTDTTPLVTQFVKVTAALNTASSNVSAFAGPGGLTVNSGSSFSAFNIYSGGKVILNGTGTKIGDSSLTSKNDVANVACNQSGANSRFPYVCPNSDQPITTNNNTLYGQTCASSQTTTTGIVPGNGQYVGLQPSCSPLRNLISTIDRSALLAGVPSNPTPPSCSSNVNIYPASAVYASGDMNISGACSVIMPPIMYINGNVNITGSQLVAPDSAGLQKPLLMASGTITINNSLVVANSAYGTPVRLISFASSDSGSGGCSVTTTCTGFQDNASGWTNIRTSLSTNAINLINGSRLDGGEATAYFGGAVLGNITVSAIAAQQITVQPGVNPVVGANGKSVTDLIQSRWVITNYQRTYAQ